MLYDNLRAKLRARRKQIDLNQRQVAQQIGVDTPSFNQLELGNRPNPTIRTLHEWARSLGGRLIIDVEFPNDVPVQRGPICKLESPSTYTCACPNWRHCYLNNEAEAS